MRKVKHDNIITLHLPHSPYPPAPQFASLWVEIEVGIKPRPNNRLVNNHPVARQQSGTHRFRGYDKLVEQEDPAKQP